MTKSAIRMKLRHLLTVLLNCFNCVICLMQMSNNYDLITEIHVPMFSSITTADRIYFSEYKSYFAFSVKGCREAFVSLLSNKRRIYEIALGREHDRRSTLRKIRRSGWDVHMGGTLDCNKFSPFYVTWKSGKVKVGQGLAAGKNEILSIEDNPVHPIDEITMEASYADLYYIIENGMSVFYIDKWNRTHEHPIGELMHKTLDSCKLNAMILIAWYICYESGQILIWKPWFYLSHFYVQQVVNILDKYKLKGPRHDWGCLFTISFLPKVYKSRVWHHPKSGQPYLSWL